MQPSSFRFSSHQHTDHDTFFSGQLQLKVLGETDVIALLPKCLPDDWHSAQQVIWYPSNSAKHHPPKEWLELVWRYLVKHFDELDFVEGLPLIPVDMSENEVTLARLCRPSALVVQKSRPETLDGTVASVLENLGMTVISELPNWVRSHPSIHKYVCSASVHSVLQAMETQFSTIYEELEEGLQCQSDESKRALRRFIAGLPGDVPKDIKELIRHLPVFETRGCGASTPSRFVTAREIGTAAPPLRLPVEVLHELIDIRQEDSLKLGRLAEVRELTFTDLLKLMMFEDVRKGRYPEEDVDRLMKHVFDYYSEYHHEIADTMRSLPFVPKSDGQRVKPSDLFDGTVRSLRDMFVDEDVFPCGQNYTCPVALEILRGLGLKKEEVVTACDFLQSVRHVEKMNQVEEARKKARALLVHLNDNPSLMEDEPVYGERLGEIITRHPWIPTTTRRPTSYPQSLLFCTPNDTHFLKPTEVTSYKFVYVSGSVRPVVHIQGMDLTNIAKAFGWTEEPSVKDVVAHLRQVVERYDSSEKEIYMGIVRKIYSHLQEHSDTQAILSEICKETWIWNGDGFSSPDSIVIEKPSIELSPYICPLPSEVKAYEALFIRGGMMAESQKELLLKVLGLIKEKYDQKPQGHSMEDVRRDLKLSILIVNELKPKAEGPCLEEGIKERLLIPTKVPNDSSVRLLPVEDCTYCDEEWLKQGHDTSDVDEDGEVQIEYVHQDISQDTAESLGVPSLMSRMLDADELDVAENFGQEEPLTRSIHRLLEGYTDGFAVPKELIQNADDAGATEVKFLYDERLNKDCLTCLFDKGMEACQGPALWAYNNAVFTDDDFINITKLNGATKEGDTQKIGKFGSGFNAVYNLTDVPSFVSRDSLVIFDPHRTHLGKAVKNGKPGIRIDLRKNKQKLRKLANQFKPFNGIFGCDLSPDAEGVSYNGTLFRFPLRTREQARKSELKELHYDDREMRELLEKLVEGAELLLQFTQTVRQVSVYHLQGDSPGAPEPLKLFEVTKEGARVIRDMFQSSTSVSEEQGQVSEEQFQFLKASSLALKSSQSPDGFPRSSLVLDVEMKYTNDGLKFFSLKEDSSKSSSWLISSTMGTEEALQIVKKDETLVPTGGVSIRLQRGLGDVFTPAAVDGKVFCFLPLPLPSGMPVHVNGFFAVASDRRHLKEKTDDDKHHQGDDWNEALLKDAISNAYISALHDLRSMLPKDGRCCLVYDLWPKQDKAFGDAPKVCQVLLYSFYDRLLSRCPALPLFTDGTKWGNIDQVVFLDPVLRNDEKVGDAAFEVFKAFVPTSKFVVDIPGDILDSIKFSGFEDAIDERTYDKEQFYREIVLANIGRIDPVNRNRLVLHAVDDLNLRKLLKNVPCIPVTPHGRELKSPKDLIHPNGKAASLYGPEDAVFPHGTEDDFLNSTRLDALVRELGMRKDDLSWDDLIERAQSVLPLSVTFGNHEGALQRTQMLIEFLNYKLRTEKVDDVENLRKSFSEARFLPILSKPEHFAITWKGDCYGSSALLAPKDVFKRENANLVSCTWPILDDTDGGCGRLSAETDSLLGFQERTVCLNDVMTQLDAAIASKDSVIGDTYTTTKGLVTAIYNYLQVHLVDKREEILPFLAGKKFILVESDFVKAEQVVIEIQQAEYPPHLFILPREWRSDFRQLLTEAGVRNTFGVEDYQRILLLLKERFGDGPLDDDSLKLAISMMNEIESCYGGEPPPKLDVYLPNTHGRLYESSELCIVSNCAWFEPDEDDEKKMKYVHKKIPPHTAIKLGVKTEIQETLLRCSEGIPFGQHEELTNRIQRILSGYPGEKELLREILQNADDAQATELHFIKDARQHDDERVFTEKWKSLQGPALCVFNNKPFTKADIAGIQNLGGGSKSDDPNKTGQYGVGFNAVYHLTDAPSFFSRGGDMGDVLCVFDPQCKFVDGATPQEPGRMFNDIDRVKRLFPDVYPCYLQDQYPGKESSTLFRFPLRTPELASNSAICEKPVTVETLDKMMSNFKTEMFDVLLFVNHVRKISLCEVANGEDRVKCTYEVTATLSEEDSKRREEFSKHVAMVGKQLKEKTIGLSEVPLKEVSYLIELKDNQGRLEKWLVFQRVGFEKGTQISPGLLRAFHDGDLTLLPRGGVAHLLESKPYAPHRKKPRVFCFLPLPFSSDLPVSVNGHFFLDHESRRTLWKDEVGGYRSEWNSTLLIGVIAPCYVGLLAEVRKYLRLPVGPGGKTQLDCDRLTSECRIASYLHLFPCQNLKDPYWINLAAEVFRYMDKHCVGLLPVLQNRRITQSKGDEKNDLVISWFPPSGKAETEVFFCDPEWAPPPAPMPSDAKVLAKEDLKSQPLQFILLDAGFNVVEAPSEVYESFEKSNVCVSRATPDAVVTFFKTYRTWPSFSHLPDLPQPISANPLKDVPSVLTVLKYCKKSPSFLESLKGLHLLVTQDRMLKIFDCSSPTFLSDYLGLLPTLESEFVHQSLVNVFSGVDVQKQPMFKVFDVNALASRLSSFLPGTFANVNDYIQLDPSVGRGTCSRAWIALLWNFLRSQTREILENKDLTAGQKKDEAMAKLEPLNQWCLLPAVEGSTVKPGFVPNSLPLSTPSRHYLVPIHMASTVIDFPEKDAVSRPQLKKALQKVGLPELNREAMWNTELAQTLVASLEKPRAVLQCLHRRMIASTSWANVLELGDCTKILQYFNDAVGSLGPDDKVLLKMLPLYHTVSGNLVSLTARAAYVLTSQDNVLANGMANWQKRMTTVFLRRNEPLESLYSFLGVKPISETDLYCKFIFQTFGWLEVDEMTAHLEHIRDSTILRASSREEAQLLEGLRSLRCVQAEDSSFQTASYFYDPKKAVFKAMLPANKFPPDPFSSPEWLPFLRNIGLVHQVTDDHFVDFAWQVATEAREDRSDGTREKSHILLEHLFQRDNVATAKLLNKVRNIPFIHPHVVPDSHSRVHPQFGRMPNGLQPYICFEGAVVKSHKDISWTSVHLLPRSANPYKQYFCGHQNAKAIVKRLGILEEPTTYHVVSHCSRVCEQWKKESHDSDDRVKERIMEHIYEFLQSHLKDEVLLQLRNTPCVLVDNCKRFVLPRQIVLDLLSDQEIRPYLFKRPPSLGKFDELLVLLGSTRVVTVGQYTSVLLAIRHYSGDEKLDPNEIKRAFKAVKGLFEKLEEDPEAVVEDTLYLPGNKRNDSDKVFLVPSESLVFDDAPQFRGRIQEIEEKLLVDLLQCGLRATNFETMISRLPERLKPRMLSSVVQERLGEPCTMVQIQGRVEKLSRLLTSDLFSNAIVRLIRHEDRKAKTETDEVMLEEVRESLTGIRLHCVEWLKTHLVYQGKPVPGSEILKPCFAERCNESGRRWNVYLETTGREKTWISQLSKVVSVVTNGLLRESLVHLPDILTCAPLEIGPFLDEQGILEDHSIEVNQVRYLPAPGTFIHVEDHHLLNCDLEDFEPEEYVGFEIADPSLKDDDGNATYIYAIIIEMIEPQGGQAASLLRKRYRINVGYDKAPIEVDALDLYKFRRVVGPELVLFEGEGTPSAGSGSQDLEEVKAQITRLLEYAWTLPKERRLKIIKRLYLTWHPDKNPGNEVFCGEVFTHLQNEIARLESREKLLLCPSGAGGSYYGFGRFYSRWNDRACSHRGHSDRFQGYHWSSGFGFDRDNPQPQEARRWLRQAQADLRAANNDVDGTRPSYEWACFKCHQVIASCHVSSFANCPISYR